MSRLDTTSLMVVVEYLNDIALFHNFEEINKRCQDVLKCFKVNPEVNQHISLELLKLFPNIQTLSCSVEDYIKEGVTQPFELYKLRVEAVAIEILDQFHDQISSLKIGVYNGTSPSLPEHFDLSSYHFLKQLEINANTTVISINSPKCLQRLKIAECRNLTTLHNCSALKLLRLYDCKQFSDVAFITNCDEMTRLEIMKCGTINMLDLKNCHSLKHVITANCENLVDLKVPDCVTCLEVDGCRNLQNLELGNGITELKMYCCPVLKSFSLPQKVKNLSLSGFDKLEEIVGAEQSKQLRRIKVVHCNELKCEKFKLPVGIQELDIDTSSCLQGDIDWKKYLELEKVNIENCSGMESIELPAHVQVFTIDNCVRLQMVSLPISLKKVALTKCDLVDEIRTDAKCEILAQKCMSLMSIKGTNIKKCLVYDCPLLNTENLNERNVPTINLQSLQL
ncbi:hypothetical protein EIN_054510 [Entamoeba invadens IP1]|uniref:hypothetical protein n=1 Tax=Entamoeba invadens IP1 TaxID=370355 RepID=UPI0002C3E8B8|nr:hypothetical protein EIN_054510 [Entamoeba invadens IP1]ELP93166.1 hypothetical protein EIN_054510 [Entamoeba invadens IP1]|eukprot:XP_004259937.1 hypothetical protein EIN_054510 [Entamoeba invadens IP1]